MDDHLLRFDKDKIYVFIDCETENLNLYSPELNLPWQIAMIKLKGEKVLDQKKYNVKWERPLNVSREAARITKFSNKTYEKTAIPFEEVFPTIEDWLDNADYVLGHNILGFDLYLIKGMYERFGKSYNHLTNKIIDTNSVARGIKNACTYRPLDESFIEYQYKMANKRTKGVRTNLQGLGKEFGIAHDYGNLHDALVDLELNVKVWNKLKWQMEI